MQSKLKSPILRAGLVTMVLIIARKNLGYEIPNEVADLFVDIVLYIIAALAMYNNPNDKYNL